MSLGEVRICACGRRLVVVRCYAHSKQAACYRICGVMVDAESMEELYENHDMVTCEVKALAAVSYLR